MIFCYYRIIDKVSILLTKVIYDICYYRIIDKVSILLTKVIYDILLL